jgi:hypothetical protein
MKKAFCLVLCVLLIACISGCNTAKGPYAILPMEKVRGKVDTEIIDRFLTDNDDYDFYGELKSNYPAILSELVNVTPKALKDKCSIYRFLYGKGGGLTGEAFLVYDGAVYPLGTGLGGWGVTEFAYINQDGQDKLYFIYSWGSGMHHSHIGLFDFSTKQLMDTGSLIDTFGEGTDIAFCLSDDQQTLGICKAEIYWSDWGAEYLLEVDIDKGEYAYDISAFEFTIIDPDKSNWHP